MKDERMDDFLKQKDKYLSYLLRIAIAAIKEDDRVMKQIIYDELTKFKLED